MSASVPITDDEILVAVAQLVNFHGPNAVLYDIAPVRALLDKATDALRAEVERLRAGRDALLLWRADALDKIATLTAEVYALKAGTGTGEGPHAYALSSGGQMVAVLAGSVEEAVRIGLPRLRDWIRYDQGDFGDLVAIVSDDMGSPDDVLIQATESAEAEAGEGGGK